MNFQENITFIPRKVITGIIVAIAAVAILFFSFNIAEECDRSMIVVNQFPVTGNYAVWPDGGTHLQWFGNVHEYHKTSNVEFTGIEVDSAGVIQTVGSNKAALATFNDRGRGYLVGSIRVILPTDMKNMSAIQMAFGSEDALINTLIRPSIYKVVNACGPLMTSLESVSETRTDLTQYITDQLNYGVYKTHSVKQEVVNELTGETETITKANLIPDKNSPGGFRRNEKSPFEKYGITCDLVSIVDIIYDPATQRQIDAQKSANLAIVTAKTRSLEAIQQTILVAEQGKQQAEKAKWDQEKIKATEVTKAQQEYEVAELAAKTAEQVARKVKAEGEAKAAANAALVRAGLTPLEAANIKKETAIGIAKALAGSTVSWVPTIMINGKDGTGGNTSMDAVGLNMLMNLSEKLASK